MKEISNAKAGLSFNAAMFKTANSGQRKVNSAPQVIATSTEGSFRITPIISKILNVQHGEYIAFFNNLDWVDAGIRDREPMFVEYCENAGLDIDSPEAMLALHKAFDMWGVHKGIKEYDSKGNPKTTTERLTKKDRMKFVNNNFEGMLNAAMNSGNEELVVALQNATDEQKVELLCPFVQARELPRFSGAKVANPAGLTGTNVVLIFTDSNIWGQLKSDLGVNATKLNRVFDVDITPDKIVELNVWNGFENVAVKGLILGGYIDEAVIDRKKAEAENVEPAAEIAE